MSDKKSIKKVRERLANISQKWKGIDLIEVKEEEVEDDVGEPETKRGDHVGFGDFIGEEGYELEGAHDVPDRKRF